MREKIKKDEKNAQCTENGTKSKEPFSINPKV